MGRGPRQVQRMLELGIHGLNVGDGTGAGQALDRTSWPTMASVGSEAAGDTPLIAGTAVLRARAAAG